MMEKTFAKELKELCYKHRIARLTTDFTMLIENHSVSHPRHYSFVSKEDDKNKIETSCLQIIQKENI